jgi:hypothetical protein
MNARALLPDRLKTFGFSLTILAIVEPALAAEKENAFARAFLVNRTVTILAPGAGNESQDSLGLGFVVGTTSDDVFIVTAGHVVDNKDAIKVAFCRDPLHTAFPAVREELRLANGIDVALLRISNPGYHNLTKVHTRVPARGDDIWVVGRQAECSIPRPSSHRWWRALDDDGHRIE